MPQGIDGTTLTVMAECLGHAILLIDCAANTREYNQRKRSPQCGSTDIEEDCQRRHDEGTWQT